MRKEGGPFANWCHSCAIAKGKHMIGLRCSEHLLQELASCTHVVYWPQGMHAKHTLSRGDSTDLCHIDVCKQGFADLAAVVSTLHYSTVSCPAFYILVATVLCTSIRSLGSCCAASSIGVQLSINIYMPGPTTPHPLKQC